MRDEDTVCFYFLVIFRKTERVWKLIHTLHAHNRRGNEESGGGWKERKIRMEEKRREEKEKKVRKETRRKRVSLEIDL